MNNTCSYICLFSLLLPKENRRKEMRFAAAQIPAKIGTHSLNGENLHRFTPFRAASNSSPFFTLFRTDFFTPPFARRRFAVPSPILTFYLIPRTLYLFISPPSTSQHATWQTWWTLNYYVLLGSKNLLEGKISCRDLKNVFALVCHIRNYWLINFLQRYNIRHPFVKRSIFWQTSG